MNYFVFFDRTGRIVAQFNNPNAYPDLEHLDIGETFIEAQDYWVQNGVLEKLPLKPETGNYWGFDYVNKIWVQDATAISNEIKKKRQELLLNSDWTQFPNSPLTVEQQTAWATYRQDLRDITTQSGYPLNVIWPTPPQ